MGHLCIFCRRFCGGAYFMAWRYYDFDANWDKVYEVWQGDAVQDVLEPDMEEWCEQAYYIDEDGHKVHPTWHRGDSLWQCSSSTYWPDRNCESATDLMASENVDEQLLAALRRHGLDITREQLCGRDGDDLTGLWDRAWDECERRCQPQRGTLDSMILYAGEEFLEDAHYVLACELFPEEQIAVAATPSEDYYSRMFLCNQHLVFDFSGYWWDKQGGPTGACPQPRLSDLQLVHQYRMVT